jgi:membrane-associated phospholipid phosphatase
MGLIETGWGLQVVLWFQSWRNPVVEAISLFFHYAGQEEFFLFMLPFVYWCVDEAFGRRLGVFFMLANWSNGWLKEWWQRPRPYQVSSQVRNVVTETSYGIPSGHAQNATTLWGAVAVRVKRGWVTALVIVYILLTALSRIVLGVHFPQDVIGGLVVGLILVGLYAWLEPKLSGWLNVQGLWAQIGLAVIVTALLLVIHPGLIPPSTPDALAGAVTPAASFLGLGIGFALEVRWVRFDARGVWWKRIIRLVIGLAVALALRFGLGALFEGLEPALLFRLIRYSLIGLWAAFAAPWIFVKTSLADRRPA